MSAIFNYTHNNHYKWGFGDEWYNSPDPAKQFKIQFGYVTREVKSFREECIIAARLIAEQATKPIIIGLSGGSDSQVACLSFIKAGYKISTVIVKMIVNGQIINEHDIKTAYNFCKNHNIGYIDYVLDLDLYYKGTGAEYAERYGLGAIETITQCAVMDFVCKDHCYIMAGGDIPIQPCIAKQHNHLPTMPDTRGHITVPAFTQSTPPVMQHMISMGYEGTSKFYLYTPELIVSYLTHPVTTDFLNSSTEILRPFTGWMPEATLWWRCFHYLFKPILTAKEWPEATPVRKFTGFEYIWGHDIANSKAMEYKNIINTISKKVTGNQTVSLSIDDLIDYVTTEHSYPLLSKRG